MSELVVGSLKGLSANNFVIDVASGSKIVQPGGILQVVSTTKTNTFDLNSQTYTDVTGLSVSITPTSTSSKILVIGSIALTTTGADIGANARLMRDSTAIFVGDSAGNRILASAAILWNSANGSGPFSVSHLDSPNTTSATTYKFQVRAGNSGTVRVNAVADDNDLANRSRLASSITVMEVAG